MTNFTVELELPDGLAQKLKSLPQEKVIGALTDTAAELVEEAEINDWRERERQETRAAIAEAIAEDDAGLSIPFKECLDRERAFYREKGLDFDAMLANARSVIEG